MSKPIKLARVHFAEMLGAHDPSRGDVPAPSTRSHIFTSEQYDLTLLDNVLIIQCQQTGRQTLVPWSRVTEALPVVEVKS
jgi:hypothetical protein